MVPENHHPHPLECIQSCLEFDTFLFLNLTKIRTVNNFFLLFLFYVEKIMEYTFVDFTSQIVGRRGVPCPTNKGISYINLVC